MIRKYFMLKIEIFMFIVFLFFSCSKTTVRKNLNDDSNNGSGGVVNTNEVFQSKLSLKEIVRSNSLISNDLNNQIWSSVFESKVKAQKDDILIIRAQNQVTTEDNLVNFVARLLVDNQQIQLALDI